MTKKKRRKGQGEMKTSLKTSRAGDTTQKKMVVVPLLRPHYVKKSGQLQGEKKYPQQPRKLRFGDGAVSPWTD